MTKRRDQGPDLFDWGAAQEGVRSANASMPASSNNAFVGATDKPEPTIARSECKGPVPDCPGAMGSELAPVVDFRERREKLPRFILHPMRDLDCMDRWIDRKHGRLAPAPILAFAPRGRPPDPGGDGAPLSRVG